MNSEIKPWSVTDVSGYVKSLVDRELLFRSLAVVGEVSNYSRHYRTGHIYFSLKDENSLIRCVMFSSDAQYLGFELKDGMNVIVAGRVTVYEPGGYYQIVCKKIFPDGSGYLAEAFEKLKQKLDKEGLFSAAHKKKLPQFPKKIGIVTSPTGDALGDMLTILNRRFPLAEIVFKGVSVQGSSAPQEIISALKDFSRLNAADLIIVGRGGGSAEDLWCFNDESLARAVYECPIPVVSAVGHENDYTIIDFVADLRAPTPSAAAELVSPDIVSLFGITDELTGRLYGAYGEIIRDKRSRLENILSYRSFSDPSRFFEKEKLRLSLLCGEMNKRSLSKLNKEKLGFSSLAAKLDALNPLSVLTRGFAAVEKDKIIITKAEYISSGDRLTVRFADGEINCTAD